MGGLIMPVQPKHPVGRNDPCPCESGLKYKKCHGDPGKIAICNAIVREKMLELIRVEQRKKIIRLQQAECIACEGTGKDIVGRKCFDCQFLTDEERNIYEYKLKSKGD